jgi:hypothetical protein
MWCGCTAVRVLASRERSGIGTLYLVILLTASPSDFTTYSDLRRLSYSCRHVQFSDTGTGSTLARITWILHAVLLTTCSTSNENDYELVEPQELLDTSARCKQTIN